MPEKGRDWLPVGHVSASRTNQRLKEEESGAVMGQAFVACPSSRASLTWSHQNRVESRKDCFSKVGRGGMVGAATRKGRKEGMCQASKDSV